MKKIVAILLILLTLPGDVLARPSGTSSSSGRSYSSSSSSGRSSSSSFGKSYSSGGSSSSVGKSYSTGGSSSSVGKSYSTGGSSGSKTYSSGGNSSSSSSNSSPNGNKPRAVSGGASGGPSSGSKSYSSAGGNSFVGKAAAAPKGNFNGGLTSAGQAEDSRVTFTKQYSTPAGTVKSYAPSDQPKVQVIRNVDESRYQNYDNRVRIFYDISHPTYYHDYWSPYLMGYLFSSAINASDRAAWVYHHRDSIDDARYQDLLARDAGLAGQLRQLEMQNVQPDPAYVLPAMANDPDLMYDKGFVDSARKTGPSVLTYAIESLLMVSAIGAGIWLFCIREW